MSELCPSIDALLCFSSGYSMEATAAALSYNVMIKHTLCLVLNKAEAAAGSDLQSGKSQILWELLLFSPADKRCVL